MSITDSPRIVIRRSSSQSEEADTFQFPREMVRLDGLAPSIRDYRKKAWDSCKSGTLPDPNLEAWRRSSLKDFKPGKYTFLENQAGIPFFERETDFKENDVAGAILLSPDGSRVISSAEFGSKDFVFCDLPTAEKSHSVLLEKVLGKVIDPGTNIFTSMAAAFAEFGSLTNIPDGVQVDKPLVITLDGRGVNRAITSHHLIRLEPGSTATVILESRSAEGVNDEMLHSGLVEIILGEGSHLTLIELQNWNEQTWNFTFTRAVLEKDATLDWTIGSNGGKFSKAFSDLQLKGQGSTGKISGFYFSDHNQQLDHETSQLHLAPNTTSDLLFKGALTGESKAVWRGMIYVSPQAVKTDGYQSNRNLVLSDKARADSIPGLEILTDDVRCTHGATVGRIDQDQIFYLESRGIPRLEAERLIVEGFFQPVLDRIPLDSIREQFRDAIDKKMNS